MTPSLLSVLVALVVISIIPTVFSESISGDFTIPDWVKNTAGWWADEQIDDAVFFQTVEFLINEEIITVQIPTVDSEAVEEVPGWVKNTAGWWAEGKIHDITFAGAIKYLISQGIMTVEQEQEAESLPPCPHKIISGYACIVEEVVEVNDFYMELNGYNCCRNWAYVGKDYLFQIETLDGYRGNPIDGVTITAKIISKDGELRYDFGEVTTVKGTYMGSITIPNMDWYAENILSVTGTYYGVEKTIEKEFDVLGKKGSSGGCGKKNPFDLSDRDATPKGIAFNNDGSKMFLVGKDNKKVYEYKLCSPYGLGSASYTTSLSISARVAEPQSIAFNSEGTKIFILDQNTDDVTEYALSTAFDISSASFTTQGCTGIDRGTSNASKATAMDFNDDGTLLRVVHRTSSEDNVMEFTLGTGFSMAGTCTDYDADTNSNTLTDGKPEGMAFSSDGKKMFILGNQNDSIYEYTLTSAYDVTDDGAILTSTFSISGQEGSPAGLAFSSDGKKMFIVGSGNGNVEINAYDLSTAWNISTAAHV